MKINKIYLKGYNQFKDLEIDLTYPKGHEKEGQPLDKICFIGQSGTGKTSLLRLIKFYVQYLNNTSGLFLNLKEETQVKMLMSFDNFLFEQSWANLKFFITNKLVENDSTWMLKYINARKTYYSTNRPILINFPTERFFIKDKDNFSKTINEINAYRSLILRQTIDFEIDDSSRLLNIVLGDIKKYKLTDLEWKNKISKVALKIDSTPTDIDKINNEYHNWLTNNSNPLDSLANVMDKILLNIGVKIKPEVDVASSEYVGLIELQTLDGKTISRDFWSTGTKQIIDTAIPLMVIKPKNAIILIDEPERSLYPNLQQKIVDFYTNLGDNCQFFFATHSPIIASSFDPWEIVELKFDESHANVIQENNYQNERHVDNYTVYPKYLKWDDILLKLFDLTDEGNNNYRIQELMKVASLKNELNELKNIGKNKGVAFEKKLNEFIKLKNKVGWNEKVE